MVGLSLLVIAWLGAGVAASLGEPDIWTHHRFGTPTPRTGFAVVLLGPVLWLAPLLGWFAMRNVAEDQSDDSAELAEIRSPAPAN